MDDYKKFRFSVTCETKDSPVLHCLRALCQWAEEHPKPQIGWGGTTKKRWDVDHGKFRLRFTKPEYRQSFIKKAEELFSGRWTMIATNDNDPATRQRPPH